MTEIVIGHERREGISAGTLIFTVGLCVGVLLGSVVGAAIAIYDPEPGQAREARPGEHCECWPTQASP